MREACRGEAISPREIRAHLSGVAARAAGYPQIAKWARSFKLLSENPRIVEMAKATADSATIAMSSVADNVAKVGASAAAQLCRDSVEFRDRKFPNVEVECNFDMI